LCCCSFILTMVVFYKICGILQIGLLHILTLLLDKTMGIFLPE
jgi:hypothetical protein